MVESELFQKMSLLPGQSLDDCYSSLSEKGHILKKPDHELLVRFIYGLPKKLAFLYGLAIMKTAVLPWLLPKWVKLLGTDYMMRRLSM